MLIDLEFLRWDEAWDPPSKKKKRKEKKERKKRKKDFSDLKVLLELTSPFKKKNICGKNVNLLAILACVSYPSPSLLETYLPVGGGGPPFWRCYI